MITPGIDMRASSELVAVKMVTKGHVGSGNYLGLT